jgi:membrane-associated phospholipid phosphatase
VYRILKEQIGFAIFMQIFILTWLFAFLIVLINTKTDIHEYLNSYHSVFLDIFFQFITFLGDGVFAVLIAILVFFVKGRKEGVLLLLTFIISAILAQGLKNFVFSESMRPLFYIKAGELNVETVDGLKMHLNHSFPSGHTTTIFALCSMFALLFNSKRFGVLLLLIAIITAYSRIYLSQHFLQDVVAGSLLGVITSSVIYYVLAKKKWVNTNNSTEK